MIGKALKKIRRARGYSGKEFAELAGYTPNYLYLLEDDRRLPSVGALLKFSEILKVKTELFFMDLDEIEIEIKKKRRGNGGKVQK